MHLGGLNPPNLFIYFWLTMRYLILSLFLIGCTQSEDTYIERCMDIKIKQHYDLTKAAKECKQSAEVFYHGL